MAQSGVGRWSSGTSGGDGNNNASAAHRRDRPAPARPIPRAVPDRDSRSHCAGAELQAAANSTLAQPVPEPQAQHIAYLPHRQSLSRHSDPLFLAKGSTLPWLKTVSGTDRASRQPAVFMITGIGVHDPPEFVFMINWSRCSRSTGFSVHDPPERAVVAATQACGQRARSCSIS